MPASASDAKIWDSNISNGGDDKGELDNKQFYAFTASYAWTNKSKWKQVPYGTLSYTFVGDPIIENGNFWVFLHSSYKDAPFLYANFSGAPGGVAELYGTNPWFNGYPYNFTITKNQADEVIIIADENLWHTSKIQYRVLANSYWFEETPGSVDTYTIGIHSSPGRMANSVPSNESDNDYTIDAEPTSPGAYYIPNDHKYVIQEIFRTATTGYQYLVIPKDMVSSDEYIDVSWTSIPGRHSLEQVMTKAVNNITNNVTYIAVVPTNGTYANQTIIQSVTAGQNITATFVPTIGGRWRITGKVNGVHYTQTKNIASGNSLVFTSPVAGTLSNLSMYLYDRTNLTPADVTTPQDIYESIFGATPVLDPEPDEADNYLRKVAPDEINYNKSFIGVGCDVNCTNEVYRDVLKFGISGYTDPGSISYAGLKLYWYYEEANRTNASILEVYKVTKGWRTNYTTWNNYNSGVAWANAGGDWVDSEGTAQGAVPYSQYNFSVGSPSNSYVELDVTSLVKEAVGNSTNVSMLLKLSSTNESQVQNYVAFRSLDYSDPSQRPVLNISSKNYTSLTYSSGEYGVGGEELNSTNSEFDNVTQNFYDNGTISISGKYDDEFNSSLDTAWFWVREPVGNYTLADGMLKINSTSTDMWKTTANASLLLRNFSGEDITLITKISPNVTGNYHGGGFILYKNDTAWVKAMWYANAGTMRAILSAQNNTVDAVSNEQVAHNTTMYLKVVKSGDLYSLSWSPNRTVWSTPMTRGVTFTPTDVGLTSHGGPSAAGRPPINYSFFVSNNFKTQGNLTIFHKSDVAKEVYNVSVSSLTPASTNYSELFKENSSTDYISLNTSLTGNTTTNMTAFYKDVDVRTRLFGTSTDSPIVRTITIGMRGITNNTFMPPTPTSVSMTAGTNLSVSVTWSNGTGNNTDSTRRYTSCYNSTWGLTESQWDNETQTQPLTITCSQSASHGYANISIYAYNSSDVGTLNHTPVNGSVALANRVPEITLDNQTGYIGSWINFTVAGTDPDSDTLTYGTNATKGTLNTTSGEYSWKPSTIDAGVYTWSFNATDGYGGTGAQSINITVNGLGGHVIAGNNVKSSNSTSITIYAANYTTYAPALFLSVPENITGTVRFNFTHANGDPSGTHKAKLRRCSPGCVDIGTEYTSTTVTTRSQDLAITLNTSETIQLWAEVVSEFNDAGYVNGLTMGYDYDYVPAIHGYILYSNGTVVNGATVLVAGNSTITDADGSYSINQSSLKCGSSTLCGYVMAAGVSGYDANATYYDGTNQANTNLTLTASGVQNINMFFNDSQKMFDYMTPYFNTTGHIISSPFDKDHFYYSEAMYADIGAKMYNSSNNRSVEMLFQSVNALNHATHDVIRTGDPAPYHGLNATLYPDGQVTSMEFHMAFSTDAMKNLRPHVDLALWNDWNTTLNSFDVEWYRYNSTNDAYGTNSSGNITNWGMLMMKGENYRCQLGNQTACNMRSNLSLKFSRQINSNGYLMWAEDIPVSAYSIFGSYWANEIVKDGYVNQSFSNAVNKTINFTKAIQVQDGEWLTVGRSSGHTWNLAQAIAFGFLQNGSDKGDWYRRADLAYSKVHQYEYTPNGTWDGAYYVVRNYYNPELRRGYMNYSGWQVYNLLTGYFEARSGQLYDSSVSEQPITYSNFEDFNNTKGSTDDSNFVLLNKNNYSVYMDGMYYAQNTNGFNNGTGMIPSRFIITWANAKNVSIVPNPHDTSMSAPSDDKYNFDYFNGGSNYIDTSSIFRDNISYGLNSSSLWQNITDLTFTGKPVKYINKSATVNGDLVHIKTVYGGLDGALTNFRQHLQTIWDDNQTVATKTINGLLFNYSRGTESFNITNISLTGGSGMAITNSAFDGHVQFGRHNSTLLYGTTTNATSHWGFDEGTSTTVSDSNTTSANTGTAVGGADYTWVNGVHGTAGNLSTTSAYINVGNKSTLGGVSNLYLGAWLKLTSNAARNHVVFSNWNAASKGSYLIRVTTTSSPHSLNIVLQNSSGLNSNVQYTYPTGINISDGSWHWVEVIYNGSYISSYVDSQISPTSTAWSGVVNTTNAGTPTYIGSSPHDASIGWLGGIDDVYLMSRVPSQAERDAMKLNEIILEYDFKGSTTNVYGYQMTQNPAVLSHSPETPVNDTENNQRAFTVAFTKTVNVTWYINGSQVQTNESVASATYTNLSAVLGNWEVNATGTNDYGSATQLWEWNVTVAAITAATNADEEEIIWIE